MLNVLQWYQRLIHSVLAREFSSLAAGGKDGGMEATGMGADHGEKRGPVEPAWRGLCRVGGAAVLASVAVAPAEIGISMLPGTRMALAHLGTVTDWFALMEYHAFLGLRELGLLNLIGAALWAPAVLAIAYVLRRENPAWAVLAGVTFFVAIGVYAAESRAFPMLGVAHRYASASSEAERAGLAAAGQVMLEEGESRSGILPIEFSFLLVSAAMLRGRAFGRVTGWTGVAAGALMMVLEVWFVPPQGVGMMVAAMGGLAMVAWSLLVGLRLLRLARA
jgi:hypothetical protein